MHAWGPKQGGEGGCKVAQPQNYVNFFGRFWALGPSDLGRGHRGDSNGGTMTFWDALGPEL